MVDATNPEIRLTMQEAAALVKKSVSTVYLWASGTDYRGRPRRALETTLLGGTRYTSREALLAYQEHGMTRRRTPRLPPSMRPVSPQEAAYWQRKCEIEFGTKG